VGVNRSSSALARQRGHAILLTLVIVFTGVTLLTYSASADVARRLQADAQTERALALAKQALIARAVADENRPGSLPCPDDTNDGSSPGATCQNFIGRLPWRTLGIGDVRDASGERLWYVVSPNFVDLQGVRINSDSRGMLTVYSGSAASVAASEVAALVIAPGAALGGQIRDSMPAFCSTTGTQIANNLCAANYLEQAADATWNNASAGGPHLSARGTASFNDRVLVLRASDFIPLVEERVGRDVLNMLYEYRAQTRLINGCDCFPWADGNGDGSSNAGANRGHVPIGTSRSILSVTRANPGVVTTVDRHGFLENQAVYFTDVGGMTELNGNIYAVRIINETQFSLARDGKPVQTNAYAPHTGGGRILPAALPHSWHRSIEGVTRANPAVVNTTHPHGLTTGQRVYLSGIRGMTQLNGRVVTVTRINPVRFSINVNTSGNDFGTYVSGGTISPPTLRYLESNNWGKVLYYTAASEALEGAGAACVTCTTHPTLAVDDRRGYAIVLISPGPVRPGHNRTSWEHYVTDPRNRDAQPPQPCSVQDQTCVDDAYFTPGLKPEEKVLNRNRLFSAGGSAYPVACEPNARLLLRNAPCHTTGTNVKPACQVARDNLQQCSCREEADVLVTPPCRNTLAPDPKCAAAVARLQVCTS
jgi:hypothetical protein